MTPTDEQARARRAAMPDGRVQCVGFPQDKYCPTAIPAGKSSGLCFFCEWSRDAEQQAIAARSASMPSVGEVLADMPPVVVISCPCGGDANAPRHQESMLHIYYVKYGKPLHG